MTEENTMRYEFNLESTYYRVVAVDADSYDKALSKIKNSLAKALPPKVDIKPHKSADPIPEPVQFLSWDEIEHNDPEIVFVQDYPVPIKEAP